MENKKRTLVICLIVIVLSIISLKINFPDLAMPVISVTEDPEAPSANGSPYKLYYEKLAPFEKQAYNMILDKIYDMPERILVPDLDEESLDNVFRALLYDNPDLFFIGRKCSVKAELWNDFFSVEYIIDKSEYARKKAEIDAACDRVISSLSNTSDQRQTELEIHNWIVDNCTYKIEEKEYVYSSVYGSMVNHIAACEGYSKAAKLLLDKVGIESAVISGTASSSRQEGGSHMWNIVKINGSWYHLDCTWDDPLTDSGKGVRLYTYFNVSDEVIGKNHFDFSIDINCISDSDNYYSSTGLLFPNYSKVNEIDLSNKIYAQYKNGERQIQINFSNEKSYKNAYSELIDNYRLSALLKSKKAADGKTLLDKLQGYYDDKELYTLTLIFD